MFFLLLSFFAFSIQAMGVKCKRQANDSAGFPKVVTVPLRTSRMILGLGLAILPATSASAAAGTRDEGTPP